MPCIATSGDGNSRTSPTQAGVDLAAWGSGACVGDADGDGRLDLYVTNWGPNALFRNRGDRTFENVTAAAGVAAGGWSTGCTFFDADGDGDLDLYVVRYVETTWDSVAQAQRTLRWRGGPQIMVGPAGLPGEADLFFENVGHGRFVEATDRHGLADRSRAYGYGVVATDYDDDGFVDLFVANDSNPNFLYRNLGNGRFESVGLEAGVAVNGDGRAQAGMGADAGDYDGDARVDLVLTTFAHDRYTLYRSIDGRHFEDASAAGIAAPTFVRMGWGAAFIDADLDRRLDLFFANGHIFSDIDRFPQLGETYRQKNQLFLNLGGRFRDVSDRAGAGLQLAAVGRGLAVGDLDNDGDVDIIVNNMDGAADVAREPAADEASLAGGARRGPGREPIRDRRKGHRDRRRHEADARDPFRRELPLTERPARVLRARRLRRSRGRGDSHAGRAPLGMETASERPSASAHPGRISGHPATSSRPMNPEYAPRTRRLLLAGALSTLAVVAGTAQVEQSANYRPELAVSEALQPFLTQLEPGSDGFPLERQAKELEARLRELSDALRGGGLQATGAANRLLDPDFRGARLLPIDNVEDGGAALEVKRAKDLPRAATLDARAFGAELQRLIGEFRDVTVAEFLITSIEPEGSADPPSSLRTTVRYDIVGGGTKAYRIEHVGEWDMGWRRGASGWQVVRWLPTSHLVSRARRPVFTEITEAALGRIDSFRRQLTIDLDSWMATFDSVLTRDSNGHHGISVGDADGDGLDDLYIAQPAGLPNRLYRNRGDSTFEDITDRRRRCRSRRHGTIALCRRGQRRRSGPGRRGVHRPAALRQRRQGPVHARGRCLRTRPAISGRTDVDRDGGLRPGRFSRSVCVRVLLSLRRR